MTIAAWAAIAPLRRGSFGDGVRELQTVLRSHGHELVVDGQFGGVTVAAVKRFQSAHGLVVDGEVGKRTAAALDQVKALPAEPPRASSIVVAPHLSVMRAITGTKEFEGGADNPVILAWVDAIVKAFPELKPGVGWYKHDVTPWCGLCVAYVLAECRLLPPLNPLWALNWRDAWPAGERLEQPCLGAIGVMSRDGGGHVTIYEGEDGTHWFGRGGNQSDAVNVARFPHSRAVAWMWPKGLAMPVTGRVRTSFNAAVSVKES